MILSLTDDCPEDWLRLGGGCYKLVDEQLTFFDAVVRCQDLGGHVVDITSVYENTAVAAVVSGEKAWIAVTDLLDEGRFLSYPNQQPLSFTGWNGHEPNDWGTGEDCTVINWGGSGKWNDMPCDAKVKAVCERGQNTHHVDLGKTFKQMLVCFNLLTTYFIFISVFFTFILHIFTSLAKGIF